LAAWKLILQLLLISTALAIVSESQGLL